MGEQGHPEPSDLALDLGRPDRTAAHDAGTAGPSMGLDTPLTEGNRPSNSRVPICRLSSSSVTRCSSSIVKSLPGKPDDYPLLAWIVW